MTEIDNLLGKHCKKKSSNFCTTDLIVRVLKQPIGRKEQQQEDVKAEKMSPISDSKFHENITRRFQSLPSLGNRSRNLHQTKSAPNHCHQHRKFRERDKFESPAKTRVSERMSTNFVTSSTTSSRSSSSSSNNNNQLQIDDANTINTTCSYHFDPGDENFNG